MKSVILPLIEKRNKYNISKSVDLNIRDGNIGFDNSNLK